MNNISPLYMHTRFDSEHCDNSGFARLINVTGGKAWLTTYEENEYRQGGHIFEHYITQHL